MFEWLKSLFRTRTDQDFVHELTKADLLVPTLGGIPSPRDPRDIPYGAVASATELPLSYLEQVIALPVWHQRKIGACVGHAGAKYKQKLDLIDTGQLFKLSARFLYALAKCRDGVVGEGTFPRLVAKILKDTGCATEETVPNDTTLPHEEYVYNRVESAIPSAAFTEAKRFTISGYAFPDPKNVNELKRAIIDGHGCILLMRVGEEWWTNKNGDNSWDKEDLLPIRPPQDVVSGHEIYLYGYATVGGRVKFFGMNSWGPTWADGGRFWFWYDEYAPFLVEAITFVDVPDKWLKELNDFPSPDTFHYTFDRELSYGKRSSAIKALQTALMIDGEFSRELYTELLKKSELGYYGDVTRRAVLDFQRKYAVASPAELDLLGGKVVGVKTQKALNKLFSKE